MRAQEHLKRIVRFMVLTSGICALASHSLFAQTVAPPPVAAQAAITAKPQTEVLLRGPIHEAFAARIQSQMNVTAAVSQKPPAAILEVPPQLRPAGNNVAWIPGYWHWDEVQKDFLWISGTWRHAPPAHRWMPGYWHHADNGYRWVPGAWLADDVTNITYLPIPQQAAMETGPVGQAPGDKSYWIPGSWVYQDNGYRWRQGYWSEGQSDWIWMPDHLVVTPRGAIQVKGYWDYRLDQRGPLFAPVRIKASTQGGARFTPQEVVDVQGIFLHMFVRPNAHNYFFGDYYGSEYAKLGFRAWFDSRDESRGYDPLLGYYVWRDARQGIDLVERLTGWHRHFLTNTALRPPHTVSALTDFALRNKDVANASLAMLGRPLNDLAATSGNATTQLVQLTGQELSAVISATQQLQGIATQRVNLESVGSTVQGVPVQALQLPQIANPLTLPGVVPSGAGLPGVGGHLRLGVDGTVRETLQGGVGGAVLGRQGILGIGGKAEAEADSGGILGGGLLDDE